MECTEVNCVPTAFNDQVADKDSFIPFVWYLSLKLNRFDENDLPASFDHCPE